jgi:MinD superfamily P-loop ATPase
MRHEEDIVNEIVVVSGKGGTGKTSLVASLAALASDAVLADCDVDASDLHLVLAPSVERREDFWSGHEAVIRHADCVHCGECLRLCRFGAVKEERETTGETTFSIDPLACEGCGVCVRFCPSGAIDFPERMSGEWFVSRTRFGSLVHARLGIGAENSGKLVSVVRKEARRIALEQGKSLLLVDGPPGIGCAVIASVTGASLVLAVTEPTLSGEHDLRRVLALTKHFDIPTAICVNKWDINEEVTERIEREVAGAGAVLVGRIPYDASVTEAQVNGKPVVEFNDGPAARAIRGVWENLCRIMV